MAQTNYTPISLYYSTTASAVPTAANLVQGELAINTNDGKLYYEDSSGVVQTLASKAGALGDVVGPASATDNALARFDLTTGKLIQNSIGILTDAGALSGLTGLTSSGSITFSSLTSGRVTYAGTAGLLQDSANLTFNGTTLTANTIGAYTLSGTIAGGGNQINNVIIGTSTPLAGSFTTINASTSITNAGLTSGRVTFAGASGLLTDSSTLTYNGTTLTASTGANFATTSGSVGIGIASPTQTLSVSQTALITSTAGGTSQLLFGDNASDFAGRLFYNHGNDNLQIFVNSAERMRITETGNVGIGTSSPSYKLHVRGADATATLVVGNTSEGTQLEVLTYQDDKIVLRSNDTSNVARVLAFETGITERMRIDSSGNVLVNNSGTQYVQLQPDGSIRSVHANGGGGDSIFSAITGISNGYQISVTVGNAQTYKWHNGATQSMTLDSSGNLLVGTTSTLGGKLEVGSSYVRSSNGTSSQGVGYVAGDNSGNDWHFGRSSANGYYYIVTQAGTGQYMVTGSSAWTAVSDERHKENLVPITDALSKVNTLRAVTGNLTSEKNNTKPYLIAQDVQKVLPEAVDSSNPEKLGLAYTDVIPLLVAAIKELKAEVDLLKQQLNGA